MYGSETSSSNNTLSLKGPSQPDKPLEDRHVPILVVENLVGARLLRSLPTLVLTLTVRRTQ